MRFTARRWRFSIWRIVPTRKWPTSCKCPWAPSNPAWPADWANSGKFSPSAIQPGNNPEVNVLKQEAKQILALFRPGTADEEDPLFFEARQMAKTDPELARWFDDHCEAYLALRWKFQAIPVPPGLKEQILSERKIHRPFFKSYWRPLLAAAGGVSFCCLALGFGLWPFHSAICRKAMLRLSKAHDRNSSAQLLHGFDWRPRMPVLIRKYLRPAESLPLPTTRCPAGLNSGRPSSAAWFPVGRATRFP